MSKDVLIAFCWGFSSLAGWGVRDCREAKRRVHCGSGGPMERWTWWETTRAWSARFNATLPSSSLEEWLWNYVPSLFVQDLWWSLSELRCFELPIVFNLLGGCWSWQWCRSSESESSRDAERGESSAPRHGQNGVSRLQKGSAQIVFAVASRQVWKHTLQQSDLPHAAGSSRQLFWQVLEFFLLA